jgi:rod shape-determining protein MreC
MAPPANRRPGYSRRAQYTIFISYFAGVAGVLLGIVLLVVSYVQPNAFEGLRTAASDITEPAGQVTSTARNSSKSLFSTVSGFIRAGSQHAKLERELAIAKVRLVEARGTQLENRRLKALLGLARNYPRPVVVTRLAPGCCW